MTTDDLMAQLIPPWEPKLIALISGARGAIRCIRPEHLRIRPLSNRGAPDRYRGAGPEEKDYTLTRNCMFEDFEAITKEAVQADALLLSKVLAMGVVARCAN